MAESLNRAKVVYYGQTLVDLTADSVRPKALLKDYTAHDKNGQPITGECTYDSDTADATAAAAEILNGKTAYVQGEKITGTMPNRGAVDGEITGITGGYAIPQGYHDGGGMVKISETERAKITPANIKAGIEVLGVTGNYGGEAATVQSKSATPSNASQTILPDAGYDYLSQVTVQPVPYAETENASGGITVTIG